MSKEKAINSVRLMEPSKNKLNLGSGYRKKEGYVNLDISKDSSPDIVCNVEQGLPFKDNSFEEIYTQHVLEHIHKDKFLFVIDEMIRTTKPGGKIKIFCPHFSCGVTYRTVDHHTSISYFSIANNNLKPIKRKFNFFRESFDYNNKQLNFLRALNPILGLLPNLFPRVYERFFCWIYPVEEVYLEYEVVK